MVPGRLSAQQLAFYRTFGFLRFPGLFAAEIDAITAAYDHVFADSGRVHDHRQALYLIPFADRSEYLSGLIDDPRIAGPVASILGSDYNYATSDGNYYVGDSMWHSDQHLDTPFHSVKVAFYLDPVTRDSGCLRLIPGSFNHGDAFSDGLHAVVPISAQNRSREVWGHGSEVPAVAIESTPGDMVLSNHKTKHSAWGGGSKRRMRGAHDRHADPAPGADAVRRVCAQRHHLWRGDAAHRRPGAPPPPGAAAEHRCRARAQLAEASIPA